MITIILPSNLDVNLNVCLNNVFLKTPNDYDVFVTKSLDPSIVRIIQVVDIKVDPNVNDILEVGDNKIKYNYQFNGDDFVLIDSSVVSYVAKTSKDSDPKNNDGRSSCFWCNNPTKKVQGFMSMYDFCDSCGK